MVTELFWLYNKYTDVKQILKITAKVVGVKNITPNIGPGFSSINFNIDVQLHNPTSKNFNINTGGLLVLKEVKIYTQDGIYLGTSLPMTSEIALPANGTQTITGIPAQIETNNIPVIIQNLNNLQNIQTKLLFEGAGQTFLLS